MFIWFSKNSLRFALKSLILALKHSAYLAYFIAYNGNAKEKPAPCYFATLIENLFNFYIKVWSR